jgi:hypothetical protein
MRVIGMDKMTATLDREIGDILLKARKTPRERPEIFAPPVEHHGTPGCRPNSSPTGRTRKRTAIRAN